jgi:hypothetical protein
MPYLFIGSVVNEGQQAETFQFPNFTAILYLSVADVFSVKFLPISDAFGLKCVMKYN